MDDLLKDVETAFLKKLITLLNSQEITAEEARTSARDYLALFPFKNGEEMKNKVENFVNIHIQFIEMLTVLKKWDEETKTREIVARMSQHIKAGNIDKALSVAGDTQL